MHAICTHLHRCLNRNYKIGSTDVCSINIRNMVSSRVFTRILYRKYLIASVSDSPGVCYKNVTYNVNHSHWYSTKKSITKVDGDKADNKIGFAKVVTETTKSAGYLGIIICGIGITVFIFYVTFKELFSSNSTYGVYNKALERCMKDTNVLNSLGEPIKAFGEESSRRRRTHVSHTYYSKNGVNYLRMKFYIQGIRRRGTVFAEVQDASGNFEFTYLYVKIDATGAIIKLEDNRNVKLNSEMFNNEPILEFS